MLMVKQTNKMSCNCCMNIMIFIRLWTCENHYLCLIYVALDNLINTIAFNIFNGTWFEWNKYTVKSCF